MRLMRPFGLGQGAINQAVADMAHRVVIREQARPFMIDRISYPQIRRRAPPPKLGRPPEGREAAPAVGQAAFGAA